MWDDRHVNLLHNSKHFICKPHVINLKYTQYNLSFKKWVNRVEWMSPMSSLCFLVDFQSSRANFIYTSFSEVELWIVNNQVLYSNKCHDNVDCTVGFTYVWSILSLLTTNETKWVWEHSLSWGHKLYQKDSEVRGNTSLLVRSTDTIDRTLGLGRFASESWFCNSLPA